MGDAETRDLIGFVDLGPVRFELYSGLQFTLSAARRRTMPALFRAAEDALGPRATPTYDQAVEAVLRELEVAWQAEREAPGLDDPEARAAHRDRLAREREGSRRLPDEPTGADVIREGLREGRGTDEILEDLAERCPSYNGDRSHVHYYRHRLRQTGELEPLEET